MLPPRTNNSRRFQEHGDPKRPSLHTLPEALWQLSRPSLAGEFKQNRFHPPFSLPSTRMPCKRKGSQIQPPLPEVVPFRGCENRNGEACHGLDRINHAHPGPVPMQIFPLAVALSPPSSFLPALPPPCQFYGTTGTGGKEHWVH